LTLFLFVLQISALYFNKLFNALNYYPMRKFIVSFLIALCIFSSSKTVAQSTVNGMFDVAYDSYGNAYPIPDLDVTAAKIIGTSGNIVNAAVASTVCMSSGYFRLYFAPGSVWTASPSLQVALCNLCADISAFIISPLTNTLVNPNGFKINLYCGTSGLPNAFGDASQFFAFSNSPSNPNQGIIDGMV